MCIAVPPNPSAPECTSHTNISLTFNIPMPCDPGRCELDGYEVIFESLNELFPYNNTKQAVANGSSEIQMTINGLTAGVTYNITLTTMVANLSSAGSNSSNCVTGRPNYIEVHVAIGLQHTITCI